LIAGIFEGIANIEAGAYSLLHRLGARPGVSEVSVPIRITRGGQLDKESDKLLFIVVEPKSTVQMGTW